MVSNSVRDGLNQCRLFVTNDHFSCFLGRCINGEDVVAVNSNGWNTVGKTSNRDTIASVLVVDRSRDSIHVVSAVEECLAAESRSEIESRVLVTFRGCTLSKVGHSNAVVAVEAELVAGARGLGHLSH